VPIVPRFTKSEDAVAVAGDSSLLMFLFPSMKVTEPSAAAKVALCAEILVGKIVWLLEVQLEVAFDVVV
jgi:hypothetical protein